MYIHDLKIVIENVRGSYKKFREGYAVEGVTFPTHYGYIHGYKSEDNKDLDVFLGNGELCGVIVMSRPRFPSGKETKVFITISQDELDAIHEAYAPVILEHSILNTEELLEYIEQYKVQEYTDELCYTNVLSANHAELINFYTNVVGLQPKDLKKDPAKDTWYGFEMDGATFAIEPMSNRDKYSFNYNKKNPVLIQFRAHSEEHLQEWTEQLEKNNVVIGQRIMQKGYGMVTTFVDPDGNVVELLYENRE